MDKVNVTIPASAEFLHVLRSVIGSIGALADAPIDVIDDLRISVDEACSQLLGISGLKGFLSLEVEKRQQHVEILAGVQGNHREWPPPGAEETLAWRVLSALVDRPEFERTDSGVGIRFRKQLWAKP